MDNFKEASRQALRFATTKGNLTTEQLWDLKLPELDVLAVSLEVQVESSGKKSFLKASTAKDKIAKLKFDIVLDILNTKADEQAEATKKKEDKAHNDKILSLIANKQEKDLEGKSVEELTALLK
jgi:hypothetical protein